MNWRALFTGRRWLWVPLALAGIAAAWVFQHEEEPEAEAPASVAASADTGGNLIPAPGTPEQLASAAGAGAPGGTVDIFAIRNWEPPPPPPSELKPETPLAPPLPFRFMGRIIDPGKPTAYLLARGDKTLVVSVGTTIDNTYRLEKFENGRLLFRYRPMNIRQTLEIGGNS